MHPGQSMKAIENFATEACNATFHSILGRDLSAIDTARLPRPGTGVAAAICLPDVDV